MKKGALIPLAIIVLVIMAIYLIMPKSSGTSAIPQSTAAGQTRMAAPTPVDYAPEVPAAQKTKVTVRDADSAPKIYLVPDNQVDTFIQKLPPGESFVSKSK